MSLVLLVEDDALLRRSMARAIRPIEGIEVLEAGSVDEALLYVDRHPPNLVVTDLDLPGRSGLDLMAALSEQASRPVIVVTAHLPRFARSIPRNGLVTILEKPLFMATLREYVKRCVGRTSRDSPSISVADFLQLAATGRRTIRLHAEWPDGKRGSIVLVEGEAWDASYGALRGRSAFAAVAWRPGARVRIEAVATPPPRTLHGPAEALLLATAKHLDEMRREQPPSGPERPETSDGLDGWNTLLQHRREAPQEPKPATAPPPLHPTSLPPAPPPDTPHPPADVFGDLLDAAVHASLVRDYHTAARYFLLAEQAQPGHPTVRANLQRLREMGVPTAGLDPSEIAPRGGEES